jgi:hypothetical protein
MNKNTFFPNADAVRYGIAMAINNCKDADDAIKLAEKETEAAVMKGYLNNLGLVIVSVIFTGIVSYDAIMRDNTQIAVASLFSTGIVIALYREMFRRKMNEIFFRREYVHGLIRQHFNRSLLVADITRISPEIDKEKLKKSIVDCERTAYHALSDIIEKLEKEPESAT